MPIQQVNRQVSVVTSIGTERKFRSFQEPSDVVRERPQDAYDVGLTISWMTVVTIGGSYLNIRGFQPIGKPVRIEMESKQTELDKTITETSHGPLTHRVRNAAIHGSARALPVGARAPVLSFEQRIMQSSQQLFGFDGLLQKGRRPSFQGSGSIYVGLSRTDHNHRGRDRTDQTL